MIAVGPNLSAVEPGQAVTLCPMQEDRDAPPDHDDPAPVSGTRLGSMPPVASNCVTRDTRGDRCTLAHGAPVLCWRAALQQSLTERRRGLENLEFQTSRQVNSR
jgi:hypothetical protein